MSTLKKMAILLLAILILIIAAFTWYKTKYSMEEAHTYQVNNSNLATKILIATQGSDFKNALTKEVIKYYQEDAVYIQVIDISQLSDIEASGYNAILLIHTWENWEAPTEVVSFLSKNTNHNNKIIAFTTSGNGSHKMSSVDALTGESKIEDVRLSSNQIIVKLEAILNN